MMGSKLDKSECEDGKGGNRPIRVDFGLGAWEPRNELYHIRSRTGKRFSGFKQGVKVHTVSARVYKELTESRERAFR
jgi:hypothetical protein